MESVILASTVFSMSLSEAAALPAASPAPPMLPAKERMFAVLETPVSDTRSRMSAITSVGISMLVV